MSTSSPNAPAELRLGETPVPGAPARAVSPLLLIVALVLVAASFAAPRLPTVSVVPVGLDGFLARVGAVLPACARLLVAAQPPAVVYYRATAALLSHRVYSFFATDYAHSATAGPASAAALMRKARQDGAGYLLLWGLPRRGLPGTVVMMATPDGVLLRRTS